MKHALARANRVNQERVLWELMGQQQQHFDGTVGKQEANVGEGCVEVLLNWAGMGPSHSQ